VSRPPERDDLDALVGPLIAFAQQQLEKVGAFFPFGCTMSTDGHIAMVAADTGSEHPASLEVIELMAAGMRSHAAQGTIKASGICYDIKWQPEGGQVTDAIAMSLEHRDRDRVLVVMPYSKSRFSGWKFGDLAAMAPGEPRVFTSPTTT
jgi:hypothetical protein